MTLRKLSVGLLFTTALAGAAAYAGMPADPAAPATARAGDDAARALLDPATYATAICRRAADRDDTLLGRGIEVATADAAWFELIDPEAPPLFETLGGLSYPVTTSNPLAQAYFDQGLRLAYGFNHAEALRAFRQAQQLDPACAMCAWGEAFVLGPNLNAPMDPAAVEPATAAAARALELAADAGPREQALIRAVAARHPAGAEGPQGEAYADAMADAAAQFPNDEEIRVLYADAVMNLSPWNYWEADGTTSRGRAGEAVVALESVLDANPDHPGAIHYYIHLVEASATPERAEPYADRLAALMPGAGHIVHMPSHIYFRIGRYLDSLETNIAAVAADEAYFRATEPGAVYAGGYYPHNVHFLLESARLAGDGATAVEAAEKLSEVISLEIAAQVPWVQLIVVAPYFAHAQFSDPQTALAVPDPGDDLPYVKAMWHYMRGVAQARAGDTAAAAEEAEALRRMQETTDFTGLLEGGVPAPDLLALARHVVQGRIAQAEGDFDRAAEAFRQAVVLQDALPYLEPPYWYYPVRQSLGAALLQAGRVEEAEAAFWQSLMDFPNNGWALHGLAEAHSLQGDRAAADYTMRLFRRAWAGDADGPDLARM
jgi:tetratricopeptide (TPR) repeat protein